jgi:hypothetical protein
MSLCFINSWAARLRVCREIASALAACHAAGVLHRDLTSFNVMLSDMHDISAGAQDDALCWLETVRSHANLPCMRWHQPYRMTHSAGSRWYILFLTCHACQVQSVLLWCKSFHTLIIFDARTSVTSFSRDCPACRPRTAAKSSSGRSHGPLASLTLASRSDLHKGSPP